MNKKQDKNTLIEKVLDSLNKDQLSAYIREECLRDESFCDRFLALGAGKAYAPRPEMYSMRIDNIIEDYMGRYGYVECRDTFDLNQDISSILEEANFAIEKGNYNVALAILIGTSNSAEEIINCGDDSAGELGTIIDECFEFWTQFALQPLSDNLADTAYKYVMKKFKAKYLEGFDWWWNWLSLAVKFATTDKKRSAVLDELNKFKKPENDNDWSAKRNYDSSRKLRMELIAAGGSKEELRKYLYDNLDNVDVCLKLLQMTWDEGNLDECLRIAQKGESLCPRSLHLLRQWQLKVYMELGETSNIICLARKFFMEETRGGLFDNVLDCSNEAMYSLMKSNVPKPEWTEWVEALAADPKISSSTLLYLFRKEKMWDKYIQYLSKHASLWLLENAPVQVRKLYKDEFVQLYAKCVEDHFRYASDRKGYREGAGMLVKLIKYGGKDEASIIIEKQKSRTPRRPALIEELSKIG